MDSDTLMVNKHSTAVGNGKIPGELPIAVYVSDVIEKCPSHVGIVGTGDFARALATRVISHGMTVAMGSRHPEKRRANPREDVITHDHVKLVTLEECMTSSDVIVVALHPEHHVTLSHLSNVVSGKIIIDVSNSMSSDGTSNAEKLALMFPKCEVVKAFNTISAYALTSSQVNQKAVSVCGDHPAARNTVAQFVNRLGFLAVDSGSLIGARRLEESNRELFPGWGYGTITTGVIFTVWTAYAALRYYVYRPTYTNNEPPYEWYVMFSEIFSKVFGDTAITLLALAYIPGPIAALIQLSSGTKHRRFRKSMEHFLAMRKALGLKALLLAAIHGIMFIFVMSGAHVGSWYESKSVILPANATNDIELDLDPRLNWKGQLCGLFGALAMAAMAVVGITSIGSVASSMNWREWQCIQSHVGFVLLVLSVLHVAIHAGPDWYNLKPNHWPARKMTHTAFLSVLLPIFALIIKFVILTPCVYLPVQRIRRGWERGEETGSTSEQPQKKPDASPDNHHLNNNKVHPTPDLEAGETIRSINL